MTNYAARDGEEAAIRRARDLLGSPRITPEAAQRDLRGLRRFCLWSLAVFEVFVMVGRLGLHGQASEAVTWIAVGGQMIFLGLVARV